MIADRIFVIEESVLGLEGRFGQFWCTFTAIVDPMTQETLDGGAWEGIGTSRAIYDCMKVLRRTRRWSADVKQTLREPYQAKLQRYHRPTGGDMIVIHAMEPNFNINTPTHARAIEDLALLYYHIFKEFIRAYPRVSADYDEWSELRLFPLGYGLMDGDHRTRHVEITALAIERGADMLNDQDYNGLMLAQITLCIASRKDTPNAAFGHYWDAFKGKYRIKPYTPFDSMGANYPEGHIFDNINPWDGLSGDEAEPKEKENVPPAEECDNLGMAPPPEFVEINEASQKSAEKEATRVVKSLNKIRAGKYASLPSPALSQAERDWESGDWFGTTDESNPDIDADPSAYSETGENVIIQPLRHRLWAKVWAAMDHNKLPEEAAYALWANQENILPPSSIWMGPDGQSCLPTTVASEKKKALTPEECGEQETALGENSWDAPYPDEGNTQRLEPRR
jgi:hypothetical protein